MSSITSFELYRRANRIAYSQPERAAALRMLAAYGPARQIKKDDDKPTRGSRTHARISLAMLARRAAAYRGVRARRGQRFAFA